MTGPLTVPHPHHQDEYSSMVLARSSCAARTRGQDGFSCFHALRAGSPTTSSGPVLLCCPGEEQRPLAQGLQLVRGRTSSPALTASEPALLPATQPYGRGGAGPGLRNSHSWEGLPAAQSTGSFYHWYFLWHHPMQFRG